MIVNRDHRHTNPIASDELRVFINVAHHHLRVARFAGDKLFGTNAQPAPISGIDDETRAVHQLATGRVVRTKPAYMMLTPIVNEMA